MGWLFYHRNKQGLRVEPDESIAEHGENNKIEEGSSKLLSCLSNKDLLDSSYTNQSYRVLLTNTGVGDVVEVKYLYAFKESNCLHQPVYLGPRIDVLVEECTIDQLKYKKEDEE